ncbi:hypothetical protein [Moheibacter sediminis]|uniref:hypothetical protein n=1 Tax=Moheibacter sediminis TaxID=1434700 RepID=UPI00135652B8|nr:hypothetical protein [Moheibacter sediminis]
MNYRIYAEVWYLDILTDKKWECLVCGDYEVIMPIPLQSKFGIRFVLQPIFCQQLGVFYKDEISEELFSKFEAKLHKYRVRNYCFNEENTERFNPKGKKKTNHVLDLNLPYEQLRKNYNRNRRRKLIPMPDFYVLKLSDTSDDFIRLFKEEYPDLMSDKWADKLQLIMKKAFEQNIGYQCRVEGDNQLIAGLFYIKTHRRIFQLGAARDKNISDIGFFTIIIDYTINLFSNSKDYKFDFEGSSVPGVALFNESFGAEKKYFTYYQSPIFNFLKT